MKWEKKKPKLLFHVTCFLASILYFLLFHTHVDLTQGYTRTVTFGLSNWLFDIFSLFYEIYLMNKVE